MTEIREWVLGMVRVGVAGPMGRKFPLRGFRVSAGFRMRPAVQLGSS